MTKQEFMAKVGDLYRACNMADSDNPERAEWMKPDMAGLAGCAPLDVMLRNMIECGALTADEHRAFYDTL